MVNNPDNRVSSVNFLKVPRLGLSKAQYRAKELTAIAASLIAFARIASRF